VEIRFWRLDLGWIASGYTRSNYPSITREPVNELS